MPTIDSLLAASLTRRRAMNLLALGSSTAAFRPLGGLAQTATPEASIAPSSLAPFLDAGMIHDISVSFDQAVYDDMIATFGDTGDKEWISASITIDGSSYDEVGLRLKGNSSLMGLRAFPAGGPAGGGMGGATAEEPESLPWLVRMDEFIQDQHHEEIKQIVIRSNNSQTSLNEAVALELLQAAGLASQQAAMVRFQVNGSSPVLRLAIEHPKKPWMRAHFGDEGFLYKAESGGDYRYRGDEAIAYKDIFDIEAGDTGDDQADMTPLVGFLDFINNTDDTTFAADLAQHLDIERFVTYLAMMNLVRNVDDIDGPGNNSYLHVGADGTFFTVVPWDMNLAFGGLAMAMGEFGGQDGDRGTGDFPVFDQVPAGGTPPAGLTDQIALPAQGTMPGGGFGGQSNILVERTASLPDFTPLVTATQARLADELYTGGMAESMLARWSDLLLADAGDLVPAEIVASEADDIRQQFTNEAPTP